MNLTQFGNDGLGGVTIRDRLYATQETALLDEQFTLNGSGNGQRHEREGKAETGQAPTTPRKNRDEPGRHRLGSFAF